jgi:hypothetical protein
MNATKLCDLAINEANRVHGEIEAIILSETLDTYRQLRDESLEVQTAFTILFTETLHSKIEVSLMAYGYSWGFDK